MFEKTTTPLTYWFYAIFLQNTILNGVAAKELERQLSICYHTALRMAHQIKRLMANKNTQPLTGIVEMDETAIGMAITNMSKFKRKEIKEQGTGKKLSLINKTIVFGMIDRNGEVRTKIIDNASKSAVLPIILENIESASEVFTDTAKIYLTLKEVYYHSSVNHEQNEYVRGKVHTNTIEGFWSQLKRTLRGTHIHVSAKYLPLYMDEVAYRWMNKDKQDQMFNLIINRVAS